MNRKKRKILERLLQYIEKKEIGIDYYMGILNRNLRDPNLPILLINTFDEKTKRIENFLEKYYDESELLVGYSENYESCHSCGCVVVVQPQYNGWQRQYNIFNDCELLCDNCVTIEDIIEEFKNCTTKAPQSHWLEVLQDSGFQCFNNFDRDEKLCKIFEAGWHHKQDNPDEIITNIESEIGSDYFQETYDYIFIIDDIGQFHCNFILLLREKQIE